MKLAVCLSFVGCALSCAGEAPSGAPNANATSGPGTATGSASVVTGSTPGQAGASSTGSMPIPNGSEVADTLPLEGSAGTRGESSTSGSAPDPSGAGGAPAMNTPVAVAGSGGIAGAAGAPSDNESEPSDDDGEPSDGEPSDGEPSEGELATTCNLSGAARSSTPTLWVIGDSTASIYASELYPRMGWAQPLQDYFAPACASVQDRAISGRSSKSFFDEGAWAPVRDALRVGDYVLIQFGHNDEKSDDPTRYTEPFTTFRQQLSIYVDDALDRGATPVLLTPINRNNWTGASVRDTHGDYPVAMRQLAAARGVALIDTTALTKVYFERLGQAATTELFMDLAVGEFPNYPEGNVDNTHLQEDGAHAIAELILADFARQGLPIGRLVMKAPVAP